MRAMGYDGTEAGTDEAEDRAGGVSADWMYMLAAAVAAFVLLLPML